MTGAGRETAARELSTPGTSPSDTSRRRRNSGLPRPPTPEELAEQVKAQKRADAKERAIAAIQANATGAPWGAILYDLAVAQGLIEE